MRPVDKGSPHQRGIRQFSCQARTYRRCLLLLLLFALGLAFNSRALIFPLSPDANGNYDVNFNRLYSFNEVWKTNQHAIYNLHALNGVAVAPRWFVTAWHVAAFMNTNNWFNDDFQRYYVSQTVNLGDDLALIKVATPVPFYSRIRTTAGTNGEILTVYGQSAAAREPILDRNLNLKGWKLAPTDYHPAPRWGRARRKSATALVWDFTRTDVELGNNGLNCPAAATNDSGGGIFAGPDLIGVMTGGLWSIYRTNQAQAFNCNDSLNVGHIFDPTNLYFCSTAFPPPQTISEGVLLYPHLYQIFARICPSNYFNAGGPTILERYRTWQPWTNCPACSYSLDGSIMIDTSGVPSPAPEAVYKSAAVLEGKPKDALTFVFEDLVKYEGHTVRLHFAGIHPCDGPGVCTELITVNGQSTLFDPFTGVNKASQLTLTNIYPDENNRITLTIQPQNPGGNAMICGLELLPNPHLDPPPALAPAFGWDSFHYGVSGALTAIAFGDGKFVAGGSNLLLCSEDDGRTWHAASVGEPQTFGAIEYIAGSFVTVGSGSLLTSSDGRKWTPRTEFGFGTLAELRYGNGIFWIGGVGFYTSTSSNLTDWTALIRQSADLAAFGNGGFVTSAGVSLFYTSTDGINWESFKPQFPDLDPGCSTNCLAWRALAGLTFADGQFVTSASAWPANADSSSHQAISRILTSTNGVQWSVAGPGPGFDNGSGDKLRFLDHTLVDLYQKAYSTSLTASNGWVPISDLSGASLTGAAFGNSSYILVGYRSGFSKSAIFRGRDLALVESVDPVAGRVFQARVAASGQTVVTVHPYPELSPVMLVSTNLGKAFTASDFPFGSDNLTAVQFANQQFVSVGLEGTILWSTNASSWQAVSSGTTNDLSDLVFGNGLWVAVGAHGTILTSPDASAFSLQPPVTTENLNDVAFGSGTFIAAGNAGTIVTSQDANSWSVSTIANAGDLIGICYGSGFFVAIETNGIGYVSADGKDWTTVKVSDSPLSAIAWASGRFLATEPFTATAHTSVDGATWFDMALPRPASFVDGSDGTFWLTASATGYVQRAQIADPGDVTIQSASLGPTGVTISFTTPVTGDYVILSSDSLSKPAWNQVGLVAERLFQQSIQQTTWTDTNRVESAQFYRVRLDNGFIRQN